MNGTIVNIQHYAVHDGPGIRTLVFMKGCPLRCPWCCNPESQSARIQLRYIGFRCKMCLECVTNCPTSSISVREGTLSRSFDLCNQCQSKVCIDKCNYDALSLSGREITSGELTEIVARDIPFYRNSGGGVTFSGGEPLMQSGFLLDVLKQCKQLGIHTAIETCGWAELSRFRDILPYTDLFLYDLKIIDPEQHLRMTGKEIGPVLSNLEFLASEKGKIIIRLPLIPGITDTPGNLESIAEILTKNGLKQISLEPYHTLGSEKYREHGMNEPPGHLSQYGLPQIKFFSEFFVRRGIQCEIA